MKIIILNFFLLLSIFLYSQDHIKFRNALNEGTYWFYEQEYDSALNYFSIADKMGIKFYPIESHLYSRTLWEKGLERKAIKVLKKTGIKEYFLRDTTFYLGMNSKKRFKISKKMSPLSSLENIPDTNFCNNINFYDQRVRNQDYIKTLLGDDFSSENWNKIMRLQDSIHEITFYNYIINQNLKGSYSYFPTGFNLIFMHCSQNWFIKNIPLFLNEIKSGRLDPYWFAKSFERKLIIEEKLECLPYNVYFPKEHSFLKPEIIFYNSVLIGLNPYYHFMNFGIYPRGYSYYKSKLYDYYKENKQNFNCFRYQ